MTRARIDAIDLVRGALMILIVGAHATIVVEPGHHTMLQATRYLLSGTVGFTTVSGLLVGWFAVTKRDRYPRVTRRYLVQAARLVLIAHPLMALALFLPNAAPFTDYALRTLFITDTLALLFVVVVPIVPGTAPRVRRAAGVVMVVADALLDLYVAPGPATGLVKEILCGVDPLQPHVLISDYGVLPLGGMFLIGSVIGGRYAEAQARGDEAGFADRSARAAAILAGLGAALVGLWRLAHVTGHLELARLLYPDYETTLYPIYLAWTLLMFTHALRAPFAHPLVRAVVLLGKTSLFVYVAQYYLVETVPTLFGWKTDLPPLGWAAVWLCSTVALVPAAAAWSRWRAKVRADSP